MVSDAGKAGSAGTSQQPRPVRGEGDQSRVLPLLAAERLLRAVLLVGVGLILLTHAHTDWMAVAGDFAARAGLDPSRNQTGRFISSLAGFGPRQAQRYGAIAMGYGVLEAVEGYGLLRRRLWGEYLTIVSTALLIIPEVSELLTHPTGLKVGGLLLNIVIVGYLIVRLIRRRRANQQDHAS